MLILFAYFVQSNVVVGLISNKGQNGYQYMQNLQPDSTVTKCALEQTWLAGLWISSGTYVDQDQTKDIHIASWQKP